MKVSAWNLIGSWGSLSDLNNNSAGCDMAVSEFDYSTNNWGRYLSIVDGDQVENGRGYFVWAFANRPLTEEQIADSVESGNPITATTTQLNTLFVSERTPEFAITTNSEA